MGGSKNALLTTHPSWRLVGIGVAGYPGYIDYMAETRGSYKGYMGRKACYIKALGFTVISCVITYHPHSCCLTVMGWDKVVPHPYCLTVMGRDKVVPHPYCLTVMGKTKRVTHPCNLSVMGRIKGVTHPYYLSDGKESPLLFE